MTFVTESISGVPGSCDSMCIHNRGAMANAFKVLLVFVQWCLSFLCSLHFYTDMVIVVSVELHFYVLCSRRRI